MAHGQVVVRAPLPADHAALLAMWDELRARSGRGTALAPLASAEHLEDWLERLRQRPDTVVRVGLVDGEVAGMACFEARPLGPFVETRVVQIDYLHVRPAYARRGVASALVCAATEYAEGLSLEHVSVTVFPQLREAHRFYARLGFSPLVVRRVASVPVLRRRLGLDTPRGRRAGMLARRRLAVRARVTG